MDDLDIYKKQNFNNPVGLGEKPAVVTVDFIHAFTDPEHFGGGNITDAVKATEKLLAGARKAGWPIAHSRVVYAEDGADAGAFAAKAPGLLKLTEASPLSHLVPEMDAQPGELIVRKTQASSFFGTDLAAWLRWHRVDTLLVTGCTTSGCVRATVVDAVSHNFRTIVLTDCVGDRAMGPHHANLFDMGQKYADLMPRDAVLAAYGLPVPA